MMSHLKMNLMINLTASVTGIRTLYQPFQKMTDMMTSTQQTEATRKITTLLLMSRSWTKMILLSRSWMKMILMSRSWTKMILLGMKLWQPKMILIRPIHLNINIHSQSTTL